jgi:anti-anti-sigma regulatory factor
MELRVRVSGNGANRVLHAAGYLSEPGSRLLAALAEQSIRSGCAELRLNLADVTATDTAGLSALRQLAAALPLTGVDLKVNESRLHHT